jgi:hypothetical protein
MQRLWDAHPGLLVAGNFLYLPLMYDPSIVRELESRPPAHFSSLNNFTASSHAVLEAHGSLFVKTVSLESLLEHYAAIDPVACDDVRRAVLRAVGDLDPEDPRIPDPKLAVILFQIMPHFLRRSGSFRREGRDQECLLQLISQRVQVPSRVAPPAGDLTNRNQIDAAIASLAKQAVSPGPPPSGVMPADALKQWFFQALAAKIAAREQARLAETLVQQDTWTDLYRRHAGLLAYLADKGSLEVDGFGFSRLRGKNEYRIYKRTGVYALKDYYGRPYIFPDCRVAVSTSRRLKPFVIDHYKHPLLRRHGSGQEICLPKDFQSSLEFTAANVIQALEAGINALFYGYNARRRNGYHSLDRIHQERFIEFDDYRVPPDDPKIVSGEVEIKNIFS